MELYDYHGTLKHGFLNSVLGQKDCLATTDGYNYLAIDDDVWVYTGVTSITGDQSNVGVRAYEPADHGDPFLRGGRCHRGLGHGFRGRAGAEPALYGHIPASPEYFGEPTYFIALKDDAGLVKMYAMVNVQKYQIVATGDTVSECEEEYTRLMYQSGIKEVEEDTREIQTVTGAVTKIAQAVVEGNSHYYLMIEGSDEIFDVSVADYIDVIRYNVGDHVTIEYKAGEETNTVLSVNRAE